MGNFLDHVGHQGTSVRMSLTTSIDVAKFTVNWDTSFHKHGYVFVQLCVHSISSNFDHEYDQMLHVSTLTSHNDRMHCNLRLKK